MSGRGLIRCFVAIDLDNPELVSKLSALQSELSGAGMDVKLVDPNSLHLTLQFLGEIPQELVKRVSEKLSGISFRPFSLRVRGVGYFPGGGRINVVWVGVEDPEGALAVLQREVSSRLSALGLRPDKEFSPHVTLMRVKVVRDKPRALSEIAKLREYEVGEWSVNEFKLKRSTLTSSGPIYDDLLVVRAKSDI